MLNLFYLLLFSINILICQQPWGGTSVATPDNLDAITYNPAGLGIDRGSQKGMFFPFDSVFTIHKSRRVDGFGYDLKYEFTDGEFPDTFNPADGNLAFGSKIFNNAYFGIKWNKHHFINLGLLYIQINQDSLFKKEEKYYFSIHLFMPAILFNVLYICVAC